jgi:hypothetical protein
VNASGNGNPKSLKLIGIELAVLNRANGGQLRWEGDEHVIYVKGCYRQLSFSDKLAQSMTPDEARHLIIEGINKAAYQRDGLFLQNQPGTAQPEYQPLRKKP